MKIFKEDLIFMNIGVKNFAMRNDPEEKNFDIWTS